MHPHSKNTIKKLFNDEGSLCRQLDHKEIINKHAATEYFTSL